MHGTQTVLKVQESLKTMLNTIASGYENFCQASRSYLTKKIGKYNNFSKSLEN